MSPRFDTLGLSVTLVVLGLAAPAAAQPAAGTGAGLSWAYHGLGGGPYVGYHPRTVGKQPHKSPATYGPTPSAFVPGWHHWVPPAHPGVGYGWLGYRTPSPRPKPPTVSVYPAPPPEPAAAADACLRVAVKLPDAAATVWFGETPTVTAGADRLYESPPLAAGQSYTYTVTAKWAENGKERTESRTLTGRPGETLTADFTN
jgi:uncharacterized protein (TIGR03000 family)